MAYLSAAVLARAHHLLAGFRLAAEALLSPATAKHIFPGEAAPSTGFLAAFLMLQVGGPRRPSNPSRRPSEYTPPLKNPRGLRTAILRSSSSPKTLTFRPAGVLRPPSATSGEAAGGGGGR